MKLYSKERLPNGQRNVYVCGVKVLSYTPRKMRLKRSKVYIRGKGNEFVNANPHNSHLTVRIYGQRNRLIIHTDQCFCAQINIGTYDCEVSDCEVVIGKGTTANSLCIMMLESGSKLHIGEDCMFSSNVHIWGSDTHSIIHAETGKLLNIGTHVEIGEHCWVGHSCKILKNSTIQPHTIVGMGSVVTGSQKEGHCAIAGVPARVVKRGISWDRRRPQQYLQQQQ